MIFNSRKIEIDRWIEQYNSTNLIKTGQRGINCLYVYKTTHKTHYMYNHTIQKKYICVFLLFKRSEEIFHNIKYVIKGQIKSKSTYF